MSNYLVTTPIYYVNAKPHIGHIYTGIAADVLARHHRLHGNNVLFSTGTDENSQKNVEAAEKEGQEVQEYVDEMAKQWERVFKQLDFTHDTFIRTTSEEHKRAVMAFINAMNQDDIYLGDYEGYYCVGCEEFKAENELVDGLCPVHKTEPKKIQEKNYFFKLTNYRQALLDHYKTNPDFLEPESARNKMLYYIEHEMEDISISRQAQEWGIRLPQDETHAIYVWFEALINYLTVAGYPDKRYTKFWPADVHIVGKDIIKFHCAIWPAMLMSANIELPKRVFAHGFFTVDGEKISKSLGNAIDPLELTQEYPFDSIRYYLLRDIPFGNDGDFSHERLKERYNADLANGLGNLVSRTLNMIEKYEIEIPDNSGYPQQDEQELTHAINTHIEALEFDKALTLIWQTIAWADEYVEQHKPWELAKEGNTKKLEEVLQALLAKLHVINTWIAPFMPETNEKLTELLMRRPIQKPQEQLFQRKA